MLKLLIGGIAVGMANIIPGVSGGTMMVVLGIFNQVMESISGLISKNNPNRKRDIMFLLTLALGAIIGLVAFANVLEFLFAKFPTQTLFCFIGMVAFSTPSLVKKEMKGDKFEILPFLLGCAVIFTISYFAPEKTEMIFTEFPPIQFSRLLVMILIGLIAGGAMFIPGVSGSMILLIIGEYYMFKSLVANVGTFQINVIVPLLFMAVGIVLGIAGSSKLTGWCLKKNHSATMNFILGLVVASSIALIPITVKYNFPLILGCALAVAIGGAIVIALEKLVK